MDYDFSGWATRANLVCSDGRIINDDAFKHYDGVEVPLVWNHRHGEPENILGKAVLEHRAGQDGGMYVYGKFNNTPNGKTAKELVNHHDITNLSIFANKLQQDGPRVKHGEIREVSLVLAGANPGAYIDSVICHSAEGDEFEVNIIYTDEEIELAHADKEPDNKKEEGGEQPPKTESKEDEMDNIKKSQTEEGDKTIKEVFDTLSKEQKDAVYAMIGLAVEEAQKEKGDENMKHNVFDGENQMDDVLMHDALDTIIADGKRFGSLKESFLQHADEFGITNIDYLFPEHKALTNQPEFIKKTPTEWVSKVMSGVHKTPFSKIKSVFADITEDEARARGYLKGNLKKDEVFTLLKRTTDPTTIYKKQTMHRDDVIDITDMDVVAWLKTEMRMMLDEEIARAVLFGDGRLGSSDDKISETNIRPAVSDDNLYSIKFTVAPAEGETEEEALIDGIVTAQDQYQGSGSLTAFIKQSDVTACLLLKDKFGHRLYKNMTELAAAMGVNEIVKVPASVMPEDIYGVVLDLKDYNVGADKGGAINMFDDFDIDYNKQKYLIETRCSGALIKPYSAIVLKKATEEQPNG